MNLQDLIIRCQRKEEEAEKTLFLHFAPKVLTLCRRYTRDDHMAEDFMQDCFIKVFGNIDKYDARKGEFGAWLYRVCTNTVLKSLRNSKRDLQPVYMEYLPETEEMTEEVFELVSNEELLKAIRELPEGYRKVLNLAIFENWTHREIANVLNISGSTSRSQLTRAKKMLKSLILKKIGHHYEERLAG